MEKPHIPFTPNELFEMLKSDDPDERAASARRIWTDWDHLEEKEILHTCGPKLLNLLQEENDTRHTWHFMIALGTINYRKAIPIIVNRLQNSTSENIRGFAADALSRFEYLDEEQRTLLWEIVNSDDSLVVQVNSIRALANPYIGTKNDEISIKLVQLLKNETSNPIKSTIIGLLGEIGSLKVVPDLAHIMIARRIEADKKIAAIALDLIAQLNGYQDRADLLKLITTKDMVDSD